MLLTLSYPKVETSDNIYKLISEIKKDINIYVKRSTWKASTPLNIITIECHENTLLYKVLVNINIISRRPKMKKLGPIKVTVLRDYKFYNTMNRNKKYTI